eukprot:TRINITY_DN2204_c0_g1_i1.p1 TRINITY_DN2204_c0_g1~~TRINITY_DN2204_c0_g1_i1.p1  ORF type:complete len:407 (+),score=61.87 TRINITY_DN2204_c0_g1_i1:66-1286(+)
MAPIHFTFSGTCFDENGLLYAIGTKTYTEKYRNPHERGEVVATYSSNFGYGGVEQFVHHAHATPVYSGTKQEERAWMALDLGEQHCFCPNYYCLRSDRHSGANKLRNWELQGSVDGTKWCAIKKHVADASLGEKPMSTAAWNIDVIGIFFRHFRIQSTGVQSSNVKSLMCAGIELYGELRQKNVVAEPSGYIPWTRLVSPCFETDVTETRFSFAGTAFDKSGLLYGIGTENCTDTYKNPHESGEVVASFSSNFGYGGVERFVQHAHAVPVFSGTKQDDRAWMALDLGKHRRFSPNYYSLRSDKHSGANKLRNWELQGSSDGIKWFTIKTHVEDAALGESSMSTASWNVDGAGFFFRHFRIQSTGVQSSNIKSLMCSGIELYGELREKSVFAESSAIEAWSRSISRP